MTHDLSFDAPHRDRTLATPSGKRSFQRVGLTVGAAIGGLYGLGAVISYSPSDPSLNVATSAAAQNLFGAPGALFADLAVQSLGAAAPAALLAIASAGIVRIVQKRAASSIPASRLAAGVAGAALLAGAISFLPTPGAWPLGAGVGGLVGDGVGGLFGAFFGALGVPFAPAAAGTTAGLAAAGALGWAFRMRRSDVMGAAGAAGRAAENAGRSAFAAFGGFAQNLRGRRAKGEPQAAHFTETVDDIDTDFQFSDRPPAAARLQGQPAPQPAPEAMPAPRPTPSAQAPAPAPTQRPRTARQAVAQAEFPFMTKAFNLPGLDVLTPPKPRHVHADGAQLKQASQRLEHVLADFGVQGEIVDARPGPVVTLFEFEPAPGVKSNRVITLADDIARSMSANAARVAVIPGRNAIGIELPNPKRETVYLRSLMSSNAFVGSQGSLTLTLGETIEGEPFVADLSKMPHLLIAGTTGSGKSVGINAMILSLLYRLTPEQCRFIMIDPKMLELSVYEGIPHLLSPVVTDPKKAVVALKWTVREMEERYRRMAKLGVRNIQGYNERIRDALANGETIEREVNAGFDAATGAPITETETLPLETMPYIVVVIDEMADLMLTAGKEIEAAVQRLAQMARAAGIHVIMATQRPSVDVITGTIKANFPTRISYSVTSKIDSRTILGEQGAEQLLGMGDLLFMAGGGRIRRLHGPFVSDAEVERVVGLLKAQGQPAYLADVLEDPDAPDEDGPGPEIDDVLGEASGDELYDRAVNIVLRDRRVSTSYLQRRLQVGYNRAATLVERMEKDGLISSPNGSGKREILRRDAGDD
jgi:S-DNA-T family DNA segregation ATPase FtsK/SpoIIIE